ncbi:hypothetical protein PCASD_00016 [Puccinia coronata f. sp. avenae]|uniref:Uncharacterized protein n=1 Tax=Puccinia coronata f. sp. avenae TaxID=200324 RepID=A0A2N5VQL6_9BASI|nr:hypothetical protein PCASD_00016 [Puccinia coronata f. sp. avenae]
MKERGSIYKRPERLWFVNLGLAATLGWDQLHHSLPACLVLLLLLFPTSPSELRVHIIHHQPNPTSPNSSPPLSLQAQPNQFVSFCVANTYIKQLIGHSLQDSELNSSGLPRQAGSSCSLRLLDKQVAPAHQDLSASRTLGEQAAPAHQDLLASRQLLLTKTSRQAGSSCLLRPLGKQAAPAHQDLSISAGCQLLYVFGSWARKLSDYDCAHFSLP